MIARRIAACCLGVSLLTSNPPVLESGGVAGAGLDAGVIVLAREWARKAGTLRRRDRRKLRQHSPQLSIPNAMFSLAGPAFPPAIERYVIGPRLRHKVGRALQALPHASDRTDAAPVGAC